MQSCKVGAKFWLRSKSAMTLPQSVMNVVPSASCEPPRVAQLELAVGNWATAASFRLEGRTPPCVSIPALSRQVESSYVTASHFGWNEEHRSTHVRKLGTPSILLIVSPPTLAPHRTMNFCAVPISVPFPSGHGDVFCLRSN